MEQDGRIPSMTASGARTAQPRGREADEQRHDLGAPMPGRTAQASRARFGRSMARPVPGAHTSASASSARGSGRAVRAAFSGGSLVGKRRKTVPTNTPAGP